MLWTSIVTGKRPLQHPSKASPSRLSERLPARCIELVDDFPIY
jgi:hypothetical protein